MQGKPYAGNPHVRFDEGAGAPRRTGRPALLYTMTNEIHDEGSLDVRKGSVLLVAVSVALLAFAGVLSVGTVSVSVDARYRVETESVEVDLFQSGLVFMIR